MTPYKKVLSKLDAQETRPQELRDAGKKCQTSHLDDWRPELLAQPGMTPQKMTNQKLSRCKISPHSQLFTLEKQHPIGTMPSSTGIPAPRHSTQDTCYAPQLQQGHQDLRTV